VAGHARLLPAQDAGDAAGRIVLQALVGRPDASEMLREEQAAEPARAAELGRNVARRLLAKGADRILRELEQAT